MRGEHVQVRGGVWIPLLLLVARNKGRVKMFRAGVIQFIDHPAATHSSIVNQMHAPVLRCAVAMTSARPRTVKKRGHESYEDAGHWSNPDSWDPQRLG